MWCILAFIFSNLFSLLIAFMYGQLRGIANTKKWYEDKDKRLTEAKEIIKMLHSDCYSIAECEDTNLGLWEDDLAKAKAFINKKE